MEEEREVTRRELSEGDLVLVDMESLGVDHLHGKRISSLSTSYFEDYGEYFLCTFLGFREECVHKGNATYNATYWEVYMRFLCLGEIVEAYLAHNHPATLKPGHVGKDLREIRDLSVKNLFEVDLIRFAGDEMKKDEMKERDI